VRPTAVDADTVRPLRREALRPGQTPAQVAFPGDEAPTTLHAAVRMGPQIVAVASVMRDPHPRTPGQEDWRIRGMATRADLRGRGLGGALLACCETHARRHGGARLWCNARVGAREFYERAGFSVEGAVFEIPEIGPHYLMSKLLERGS
jgi:GNAT superfamily N-acetyltransferase